jgi:hypothetical protein
MWEYGLRPHPHIYPSLLLEGSFSVESLILSLGFQLRLSIQIRTEMISLVNCSARYMEQSNDLPLRFVPDANGIRRSC